MTKIDILKIIIAAPFVVAFIWLFAVVVMI